jgi:hypothetical protein
MKLFGVGDIDLNWADRHVLFGGLPKLAIDKIGGDAAHERELLGLARMDFKSTRPSAAPAPAPQEA